MFGNQRSDSGEVIGVGVDRVEAAPEGEQSARDGTGQVGENPPFDDAPPEADPADEPFGMPRLQGPRRGRRLVKKELTRHAHPLTAKQRLLLLDTWARSGLAATDFSSLVGISKHTLAGWKKRFEEHGPAGLEDRQRGAPEGSHLPELTRRAILMLKRANPEYGCERISDMLRRGPALPASPSAVATVLHEEGYELEDVPTRPHPDKKREFERARPNELWQSDLFTFILKRQNRRVYLVAFMDDYSRFIVGYGLHASQSSSLVLEVLRTAFANFNPPEEILTDNGSQYVTWRGKSAFSKELEGKGIRQVVARPRHPQTLGKIERFWGTLWRECIESAVFVDLEDARKRIGHFVDHYNFHRPHQGIDGLVPADRYFGNASEIRKALEARVSANALELARNGVPKEPFYITGQAGGRAFSLHAEGDRVVMTREGEERREVELVAPASAPAPSPAPMPAPACADGSPASRLPEPPAQLAPGASALDEGLEQLMASLSEKHGGQP
jgi:transposase InsO family protein